ncbi:unnamed protein product [Bathycoccus prasinos]
MVVEKGEEKGEEMGVVEGTAAARVVARVAARVAMAAAPTQQSQMGIVAIAAGSVDVKAAAIALTDAIDATSIVKSTAIELVEASAALRRRATSVTPVINTASGETLLRAAMPVAKASCSASTNSAAV